MTQGTVQEQRVPRTSRPFTVITDDGARLRTLEDGASDAPLTVVLLHAWTMASSSWDRVVDGMVREYPAAARILRFDLRGHGGSDPAPEGAATIERCADDLAELISSEVPSGNVVLIGHSLGGMTIMALAERHPQLIADRVAGVALVATSSSDLAEPRYRLPRLPAAVLNRLDRALRPRLASLRGARLSSRSRWLEPAMRWLVFGKEPNKEDVAHSAELVGSCHPSNLAGYRVSLAEHERTDALAGFANLPVVVLAGMLDRLCPRTHAATITKAVPHAEFYLYPGAGHMLPWERTTEVTRRLNALVQSLSR